MICIWLDAHAIAKYIEDFVFKSNTLNLLFLVSTLTSTNNFIIFFEIIYYTNCLIHACTVTSYNIYIYI